MGLHTRLGFGYRVVSRDFCPWADPLLAALKTPLGLLVIALIAALLLAVGVSSEGFWAAGVILAVIVIGSLWPTLTIYGLRGQLTFGRRRVHEGEPVQVRLTLTNLLPWPVWGITCHATLTRTAPAACGGLPAASKATYQWPFIPSHRGIYSNDATQLATAFPFGILTSSRAINASHVLIVWPRTVLLTSLLDVAETRPSDERYTDARCGEAGDVLGTRPFRNGDSLRRIHWPQTARTGAIIVCERQAPFRSAVRIVFDSDPAVHELMAGDSSLDWSIRIAASIATAYHRENAAVECCFGHETLTVGPGPNGLSHFLDQLTAFKPCPVGHSKSCQHEHDEIHCRRIHHHNCGIFQVTITTDRGLRSRTEHRHVHGDQLWVVLATTGQKSQRPIRQGRMLWVADDRDPLFAFQHAWEQLCHVG